MRKHAILHPHSPGNSDHRVAVCLAHEDGRLCVPNTGNLDPNGGKHGAEVDGVTIQTGTKEPARKMGH